MYRGNWRTGHGASEEPRLIFVWRWRWYGSWRMKNHHGELPNPVKYSLWLWDTKDEVLKIWLWHWKSVDSRRICDYRYNRHFVTGDILTTVNLRKSWSNAANAIMWKAALLSAASWNNREFMIWRSRWPLYRWRRATDHFGTFGKMGDLLPESR